MQSDQIQILDCTLRDAGYPIKFQFTKSDIQKICMNLEKSGLDKIEVGHGLGVSADRNMKFQKPLVSNLVTVREASKSVKKAKIGIFYIPGIGQLNEVKELKSEGLKFLRVGYDASDIERALPDLHKLSNFDLELSVNLMKSNEITEKQLEQKLKKLKDLPLKTVSIVDSSGSMLPENVKSMVQTVCEYGFNAGFHGHNNIGLALANCLSAVEAGAKVLDGTLTGLGRSLGNANTEQLAISLRKKGFSLDYDVLALLKLAECFSRKFCNAVIDVDQILMGYAELHSGVETEVRNLCRDKKMGLREFLFKTGESFPARIHPKLFEQTALSSKEIVTKSINISWRSYDFDDFLDNLVARSYISPRKIVVVAHQNENFSQKFSNEYRIRGLHIFHVQIEHKREIEQLFKLVVNNSISIYLNPNINLDLDFKDLKNIPKSSFFKKAVVCNILEVHQNQFVVFDDHEDHEILSLCERHNSGISDNSNSSSNKVYIFSKTPLNVEEYRSVNGTNYIIDRFLLLASSKETIEENRNAFRVLDIIDLMNFWVANDHLNTQKLKVLNDPDTSWIDLVSNNFVLQGMLAQRGEIIIDIFSPEGSEVLGVADGKGGIQ